MIKLDIVLSMVCLLTQKELLCQRKIKTWIKLAFVIVLCHLRGVEGLSVVVIEKVTIAAGHGADLECFWNLEPNEQVYSIKWYQGLNEIYRYTPSKYPNSIQLFKNQFLNVDISGSDRGKVRVTNVTVDATGYFRCEVSGEAPSFRTGYGTVNVTVVAPPDGNPYISGNEPLYEVGDWVDLRCISSEASPVPKLKFFVNNEKPLESALDPQTYYPGHNGLKKTSLRLRFTLRDSMLDYKGMVKIKCTSEIPEVYNGLANVVLTTGRLLPASAYEAKATLISHPGFCLPIFLSILLYYLNPIRLF